MTLEKVNKYYDNWYLYPDDFVNLSEYDIYYDTEEQRYKVKFSCGECDSVVGWFCYSKYNMNWLLHELDEGILCDICGSAINPFEEPNEIVGRICGV